MKKVSLFLVVVLFAGVCFAQTEITKLSVTEIKALIYDESVKLQQCQNNINVLNQELKARQDKVIADNKKETKPCPVEEKKETK